MMKKTIYGKTAYEGFARAIGAKLGLKVQVDDGANACIDANGVVYLPGMHSYQTADEFAVTCGTLVHELAHQFYRSHETIDPNRSRLEHDCLNAVLDVADETWIDKWFLQAGNARPGQLLSQGNVAAWSKNSQAFTDWTNAATHAWKILCLGILSARVRGLKRVLIKTAIHAAKLGVDAKACWKLIRRARITARENPTPNKRRFRKLFRLAKELADLLAPFAPVAGAPMPPTAIEVALSEGQATQPAGSQEATEQQGAAMADGPTGKGGGAGGGGSSANPGQGQSYDASAFNSLYPAVERVAQRIALDGDGARRCDGLSNGPSLAHPHRLLTDGQAMARWAVSDQAEGVSVAVILDCSGSMDDCRTECAGVARAFALGMRDCGEVYSLTFGCYVKEVDDFDRVCDMGSTNTHMALQQAGKWLAGRRGSRWVVLITDGEPNNRTETNKVCAELLAAGVRVLAIGLGCRFQMPGALCTSAMDPVRLAIELDAATRSIEGS
jgi:hypothetical protein